MTPDILYFVNCYTGKSQWELPTKDAPETPPDMTHTFIACELHSQVRLTTMSGKYTALSYCAGSSKETTKIMINGMWFNAFANLEHSLESFREHSQQLPGSEAKLLVWTDQVCINQIDHEEKSRQVALMRQIYHQAEHVFVCLSTASNTPALLASTPDGVAALKHIFHRFLEAIPPKLRTTAHIQKKLLDHFTKLLNNNAELSVLRSWYDFFLDLMTVPWWTRAWVSCVYCLYPASASFTPSIGLPRVHCCLSCLFSLRAILFVMARNCPFSYAYLLDFIKRIWTEIYT